MGHFRSVVIARILSSSTIELARPGLDGLGVEVPEEATREAGIQPNTDHLRNLALKVGQVASKRIGKHE